jgi:hypothetical protein
MEGRPVLVAGDKSDVASGVFDMDGRPKDWMHRPPVEFFSRSKKKLREPANVMPFVAGTFVLDARARAAIGGFLTRFGQLLELQRAEEVVYAFNCTNVVDCLDRGKTKRDDFGTILNEAFDETKVPKEAAVFKDPSTASIRVYANDEAKQVLEQWVASSGVTGLEIVAPEPL